MPFMDHTWVTTYNAPFSCPDPPHDYWYCWGDCWPAGNNTTARLLGSRGGDLPLAHCLVTPNDRLATGSVNYGRDGVCHQIANQVLYATGQNPLTVIGARFYGITLAAFGPYGEKLNQAGWNASLHRCRRPATIVPVAEHDDTTDDEVTRLFEDRLGSDYDPTIKAAWAVAQRELTEKQMILFERARTGELSGSEFAEKLNALLNDFVVRVSMIAGEEVCARLLDVVPGEPIRIIDPKLAALQDYTKLEPLRGF